MTTAREFVNEPPQIMLEAFSLLVIQRGEIETNQYCRKFSIIYIFVNNRSWKTRNEEKSNKWATKYPDQYKTVHTWSLLSARTFSSQRLCQNIVKIMELDLGGTEIFLFCSVVHFKKRYSNAGSGDKARKVGKEIRYLATTGFSLSNNQNIVILCYLSLSYLHIHQKRQAIV